MAEKSNIAWTDATWNPVRGCTKVSAGCAHCYWEETYSSRNMKLKHNQPRQIAADPTFYAPLKWSKKPWVCDACGEVYSHPTKPCACGCAYFHRRRVFLGSLMDWLDPEIPVPVFAKILEIIYQCPNLDFQCVTKRPEFFFDRISLSANENTYHWLGDWRGGIAPHNVWPIISAEDQPNYDKRVEDLLKIPAVVRGISFEPLLGPIHPRFNEINADTLRLGEYSRKPFINWAIIGGESDTPLHKARPCNISWIRNLLNACYAGGVTPFVKQFGSNCVGPEADAYFSAGKFMCSHKKGGDPSEWPIFFRAQNYPTPIIQKSR